MSYADNWETGDNSPECTLSALRATMSFCDQTLMTLNANKSWKGGAGQQSRIALQKAKCGEATVPLQARERDLGFGISYNAHTNAEVRNMRIAKFKTTVTRIIAMKVAKRQRIALFKNGAFSGLLYAVGGTSWPPTVVEELRIQATKVLRPGAGKRAKEVVLCIFSTVTQQLIRCGESAETPSKSCVITLMPSRNGATMCNNYGTPSPARSPMGRLGA